NSLIGLLYVNEDQFNSEQASLFSGSYRKLVDEKTLLVGEYRHASSLDAAGSVADQPATASSLQELRDRIDRHREPAIARLNAMLLDEFGRLGIRYEEASWDFAKNKEGKPRKRPLTMADIRDLQPFHWGYEFDEVIHGRGGFDAIITNPPWDIFKPNAKEFFQEHSNVVSKKKMAVAEFEKEQGMLLRDPDIRGSWLAYLNRFPHQNLWFRNVPQFGANQVAPLVNGKKANIGLNLFKLFTEQCYNLLRTGGECGIVIPAGIYTDLGCTGLRELLFNRTRISGLFGFENRKEIFEGVHRSFKFVVLSFEKGGTTVVIPAAFMRYDPEELREFPRQGAIPVPVELVRRLSPDSLSVPEFKNELDIVVAEKIQKFPTLAETIAGTWNLRLNREFNMTDDSDLFRTEPGAGRLPLYEGKMIHQFTHTWAGPRLWIEEFEGRERLTSFRHSRINRMLKAAHLEQHVDTRDLVLDYDRYRVAFRDIAASTNERTMIATVLPPKVFCPHTMTLEVVHRDEVVGGRLVLNQVSMNGAARLFVVALLDSFVADSALRQSVTNHLSAFFVYNLSVPRLTERDPRFAPIVERAARLVCTTPEFDDLAREVGLGNHANGATNAAERARLRAELDGLIAHLYGLSEEEFAHILGTFPLVTQQVKNAALDAYFALAPNPDHLDVQRVIAAGENTWTEFKVAAAWNPHTAKKDDSLRGNLVREVAAFLNSREGGNLFLGVADDGTIMGLGEDYAAADASKPNRDGYELFLRNVLASAQGVGAAHASACLITFHTVNSQEVCRIHAPAASAPAYAGGEFYVRNGNQSRKLTAQEAHAYIATRWG
ncbi:MAG TPA: ATP-binding protein, partial [Longimicrobium sp.]|nr:ATP-binding protein [Longimicrobium sp.]